MRVAAVLLLLVASIASADTILTLGGTVGIRDPAQSDPDAVPAPDVYGGGRVIVSFEPPLPPSPAPGHSAVSARIVPELLVGALADDQRGEGFAGVGLRGDLVLATHGRAPTTHGSPFDVRLRIGFYLAARAEVIGKDQDAAAELVVGQYVWIGRVRLGLEGGAVIRREPVIDSPGQTAIPANVITNVTVGWLL